MMKVKSIAVVALLLSASAGQWALAESPITPVPEPVLEWPQPAVQPVPPRPVQPARPAQPARPVQAVMAGKIVMQKSPAPAIPAGATVTVQLLDTSMADASAVPLGKQVITHARRFPIAFRIPYSPAKINAANKTRFYTVSARVEKAGKLLFINDTSIYPFQFKAGAVVLPVIAVQ